VADPGAHEHELAIQAIIRLRQLGDKLCITAQNLIEFGAVATRPIEANGLGWSIEQARNEITQLMRRFPFLTDSSKVFEHWSQLIQCHQVIGKRAHDARLVAVMMANGITSLLSFNHEHFQGFSEIKVISPNALVKTPLEPLS
jgi:predicted nucleic acid-binding protein